MKAQIMRIDPQYPEAVSLEIDGTEEEMQRAESALGEFARRVPATPGEPAEHVFYPCRSRVEAWNLAAKLGLSRREVPVVKWWKRSVRDLRTGVIQVD